MVNIQEQVDAIGWYRKYFYSVLILGVLIAVLIGFSVAAYFNILRLDWKANTFILIFIVLSLIPMSLMALTYRSNYIKWSKLDLKQFQEVSDNDITAEEELISSFDETYEDVFPKLIAACKCEDSKGARLQAHSLKGSSRSIGFVHMADIVVKMEDMFLKGRVKDGAQLIPQLQKEYEDVSQLMSEYMQLRIKCN